MNQDYIFPKPRDWEIFEDLVCHIYKRRLDNENLQRYGRRGQKQHGVDIAGVALKGLVGIQCKHHPLGDIASAEIDSEILESEEFVPSLKEYIIATSADRDKKASSHVFQVSEQRKAAGKYPVSIVFWQDLIDWLLEYPDLVHKYFTCYFRLQELEHVNHPHLGQLSHQTVRWPVSSETLSSSIRRSTGELETVTSYVPTLGFTSFPDISFENKVDLEVSTTGFLKENQQAEAAFREAGRVFADIRAAISSPDFSRELIIYQHQRLSLAVLLGWTFRRVAGFQLELVVDHEIWPTTGLTFILPSLFDELPVLMDTSSQEVVLILNISREIRDSVLEYVQTWESLPRVVLTTSLEGQRVHSAAHALSIAMAISQRIKTIADKWRMRRIHLFAAMPAALATLVGFYLNAICPISIYHMDDSRQSYSCAGTLTNSM